MLALRQEHRGWTFPARLRVGVVARSQVELTITDDPRPDPALRADVVDALVEHALVRAALPHDETGDGWVLRAGALLPDEEECAWLREVDRAVRLRGLLAPHLLLITKTGWYDLRDGSSKTWKRLRERRA